LKTTPRPQVSVRRRTAGDVEIVSRSRVERRRTGAEKAALLVEVEPKGGGEGPESEPSPTSHKIVLACKAIDSRDGFDGFAPNAQ
jgi:hypothetical protein